MCKIEKPIFITEVKINHERQEQEILDGKDHGDANSYILDSIYARGNY